MTSTIVTDWPHVFSVGEPDTPVLLMLHGTGGNEQEMSTLAAALHPGAGVLAPRGPVQEHGMLRWFRRLSEGVFDVEDVITRAGELANFLTAAREHYNLGSRPIVAAGFSNGANIALAAAMLHPQILSRVIALSGMYPFADKEISVDLSNSSLLLVNGEADQMAPLNSVSKLVATLERNGAQVEQVVRTGGHGITQNDVTSAAEWLALSS
jgi:phospholipase/carboxylesterase